MTRQKTELSLSYAEDRRAEAPFTLQLLKASSSTVLIDSRTEAFMQGTRKHTLASTAGTLPDAKLLSNFEWFGNEKSATIDKSHISKIITEADLDPSVEVITFCNKGHWAATYGTWGL